METTSRHLLAVVLLIATGVAWIPMACIWQRFRDALLFVLVFGAVLMTRADVTFFGQFWYRGTSRGAEFSLVDLAPLALLISSLVAPRYQRARFYWPASFGLLLMFFIYCCASVWNMERPNYGLWELSKFARGLMVFLAAALFIRTRREVAIVVFALSCSACLQAFNGFEQHLFKGAGRVPGTFDHENSLSTYLCLISPVLLAAAMSDWWPRLRWFAGFAWLMSVGAEIMTVSRLGVPAVFLVDAATAIACTSWKPSKQKVGIVAAVGAAISVFLVLSWPSLKARYMQGDIRAEMTDEKAFETRGVYWRLANLMREDHTFGVGLNNWSFSVSKIYGPDLGYKYVDYDDIIGTPTKEELKDILLPPAADTLLALLIGELGIPGLIVFLLAWLRWFQMGSVFLFNRLNPDPMHRMAIGLLFGALGIFLQSTTEWAYKQPPILFTCHTLMGMLASLYWLRKQAKKQEVIDGEFEEDAEEEFERPPLPEPEML